MEVIVKSSTSIIQSPKKYDQDVFAEEVNTIDQLNSKEIYENITLNIKVLQILRIGKSTTGANIQEVVIADATGLCRCSLWETFIGQLQVHQSYKLTELYVQEYRNKRCVSNAQQGSVIEPIPNIDVGEITADNYVNEEEIEIKNATVAAVPKLECYKACMQCKIHRVEQIEDNKGRCTSQDCLCPQRYDLRKDHIMAKVKLVPKASPAEEVSITITNNDLKDLFGTDDTDSITEDALLSLPVINSVTYDKMYFQLSQSSP